MVIPWIRLRWRGFLLAAAIAVVATVIGHLVPIVGSPVSGIVIGVIVGAILKPGVGLKPGIQFSSKFVLQLSVVILGFQLSLAQAALVGLQSLPVMLGWLGVVGNMRTLIGVGTGICGASAIAAVTPVIGAVGVDVAYAISTIFLFNIIAVIAFPIIGHLLGMSQHAFGLFAGTAVNDTSSVVAAASTYGTAATNYAVVVKLVRTLMIIPISVGLAAIVGRRTPVEVPVDASAEEAPPTRSRVRILRLIPWFLIGFVVTAGINSFGFIPAPVHSAFSATSVFLITIALSAIGLSTDLGGFRRAGAKPLLLGLCLWVAVTLSSLGLQFLLGIH
jgi:uncharacterized integral membrane protein (TIGR00698 family)